MNLTIMSVLDENGATCPATPLSGVLRHRRQRRHRRCRLHPHFLEPQLAHAQQVEVDLELQQVWDVRLVRLKAASQDCAALHYEYVHGYQRRDLKGEIPSTTTAMMKLQSYLQQL